MPYYILLFIGGLPLLYLSTKKNPLLQSVWNLLSLWRSGLGEGEGLSDGDKLGDGLTLSDGE